MTFLNKTMREPVPNKPHIAFIEGRWRVSPWKQNTGSAYYKAHAFIQDMERKRLRAAQTRAVMPAIGPLLDAWDGLPNDLKFDDQLSELRLQIKWINNAMLHA